MKKKQPSPDQQNCELYTSLPVLKTRVVVVPAARDGCARRVNQCKHKSSDFTAATNQRCAVPNSNDTGVPQSTWRPQYYCWKELKESFVLKYPLSNIKLYLLTVLSCSGMGSAWSLWALQTKRTLHFLIIRRQNFQRSTTSTLEQSVVWPLTSGLVTRFRQLLKTFFMWAWDLSAVWISLTYLTWLVT